MESFLSFPTNLKINGIEITPTLNELVEKGAYYNNNMTSQIQLGESSDGQFTYLNGLTPKKKVLPSTIILIILSYPFQNF